MTALQLQWELVTDRVMGGVSNGRIEQILSNGQPANRMTGRVSLDNNGGFIQIAADLPPPPAGAIGIALNLIGNAETYNIHLRTSDLVRPWQSFRQAFTAPTEWTLCHFEFGNFEAHRTDEPLRVENIRRIGIVAIGRVFDADAAVSSVSYY
ncbi:CIA30 family protein [Anderseniella sp. Alg231-50]|uniref:CIA30 family protein n=1 Tax=Anderseniella sp. Alg231-50 TaxID=1922226 RepID=UPI000D55EA32